MTPGLLRAVLGADTSRRNKSALLAGTNVPRGWEGKPYQSRMLIWHEGSWHKCKSFDEDILPTYSDK